MTRRRYCACILCAVAAAIVYALMFASAPLASAADKPVSFINDVAPILKESCFVCHDAKKRAGKYDMTTFEKLMAGGSIGDPITAGKPEMSDFHDLIVTKDERRMPPRDKGEAVAPTKAAIIAEWIKQGAKLDASVEPTADLWRELRVRWNPPQPPAAYKFPAIINALAFTPDGHSIVAGGHHEITLWNAETGKLEKRIRTRAERMYAFVFLSGGKLVAAGGRPGQEGDVRVYDLSAHGRMAGEVMVLDGVSDPKVLVKSLLDADDSILALAISADGHTLAAAGCDRGVRVWDLSEGIAKAKLTQTIENHADWVLALAFSADGHQLFSASRDRTAKVWDLSKKESLLTMPEHQETVFGVAVLPDGSNAFSVGSDKNIRMWKPTGDGKAVKIMGGHKDQVYKLALSPTELLLATASKDQTVRLWAAKDLKAGKTLSGLTDEVFALAFSPDGKRIAAGSYAGEVRIWNVADGGLVKAFNASPGYAPK